MNPKRLNLQPCQFLSERHKTFCSASQRNNVLSETAESGSEWGASGRFVMEMHLSPRCASRAPIGLSCHLAAARGAVSFSWVSHFSLSERDKENQIETSTFLTPCKTQMHTNHNCAFFIPRPWQMKRLGRLFGSWHMRAS